MGGLARADVAAARVELDEVVGATLAIRGALVRGLVVHVLARIVRDVRDPARLDHAEARPAAHVDAALLGAVEGEPRQRDRLVVRLGAAAAGDERQRRGQRDPRDHATAYAIRMAST